MVTRISYYKPKNRIYVCMDTRNTDAYYDIEKKQWNPKKIGKDVDIIKEILEFANVDSMESFESIRKTYYYSQQPEIKEQKDKEFYIKMQLKRYKEYLSECKKVDIYYDKGFYILYCIIKSLEHQ